ncbi:MAG: hypothetical protein H6797_04810 [Candidatus Nomurabacteria bacterium]|nr:MAG: hypothetical protein H6797_04810 [Candidatus Nomurabacteria bacterium]
MSSKIRTTAEHVRAHPEKLNDKVVKSLTKSVKNLLKTNGGNLEKLYPTIEAAMASRDQKLGMIAMELIDETFPVNEEIPAMTRVANRQSRQDFRTAMERTNNDTTFSEALVTAELSSETLHSSESRSDLHDIYVANHDAHIKEAAKNGDTDGEGTVRVDPNELFDDEDEEDYVNKNDLQHVA